MGQMYMERKVELSCPRDQVWEYMSDVRRAMTLDQFHISVDCAPADAANPKVGLIVPILHRIMGWDHIRNARITRYNDYEVAWGESTPKGEDDPFPHSDGYKVEEIDAKTCLVTFWLKGHLRAPVGAKIEPYIWDKVFTSSMDLNMADLAQAVGAQMSRPPAAVPSEAGALVSLAFAETINGIPAQDFLDQIPPLYPNQN